MQNVLGSGDFDHYQGVWRMQSLPNCAPNGGDASRLTYAVEIKPKGILPVKLIEGRIASDLKANMAAIRAYVEAAEKKKSRPRVMVPQQIFTSESAAVNDVAETSLSEEQTEILYSPTLLSFDVDKRLQIAVLHKDKPKKSILRKISNYLIGNWDDDSMSVTGIVEKEESSGHASILSPLLDSRISSSSAVSFTDSTEDTVVLLKENDRLKERVAYLEGEMAKANMVLRKIEMLSKLD